MPSVVVQPSLGTGTTSLPATPTRISTQKATEAPTTAVSIDGDFDPHHPDLIVSYDVMNEEVLAMLVVRHELFSD